MDPLQGVEWLDHYTTNVLHESGLHQTVLMAIILEACNMQDMTALATTPAKPQNFMAHKYDKYWRLLIFLGSGLLQGMKCICLHIFWSNPK